MTEEMIVTGSRDDLLIAPSRCLQMRFSGSSCRLCVDSCPHGAVSVDNSLTIDPERCRGCLLCSATCPAGALEQRTDFSACLAQLSPVAEPVLGCSRTRDSSHASLPCLGGLSPELLLALCHSLAGVLTLNLSSCDSCPNSPMTPYLRQRLELLVEAGLTDGGCQIVTGESVTNLRYRPAAVTRRSFFRSLRSSLFTSAATIISPPHEKSERRTAYAEKRLPARRELLNRTRSRLSPGLAVRLEKQFDFTVFFAAGCSKCHGCVAICPTGALQNHDADSSPAFAKLLCTGCGLCREFCLDGAVVIATGNSAEAAG